MHKCTMCGNDFNIWDEQLGFVFEDLIGYGSAYDSEHLNLKLCCGCFDKMIDLISPYSLNNPVVEEGDILPCGECDE